MKAKKSPKNSNDTPLEKYSAAKAANTRYLAAGDYSRCRKISYVVGLKAMQITLQKKSVFLLKNSRVIPT